MYLLAMYCTATPLLEVHYRICDLDLPAPLIMLGVHIAGDGPLTARRGGAPLCLASHYFHGRQLCGDLAVQKSTISVILVSDLRVRLHKPEQQNDSRILEYIFAVLYHTRWRLFD